MHDPFEMPQAAFEPFFARRIAFAAKRSGATISGTLPCCISDEGYAETYDEHNTASKIGRIVILIRKRDWAAAISTPPQSGDRFVSPDTGKTYALVTATHFAGDTWSIEAREVAK